MTAFNLVPTSMYDHGFAQMSRDAQTLELYIRSCPQRTSEGLFRFGLGTVSDDLGMERRQILAALEELQSHSRPFMYDADASVLLDLSTLPMSRVGVRKKADADWSGKPDKRILGAISKLRALPPTPLLRQLLLLADAHDCIDLADAMREEFPELPQVDTDEYLELQNQAPSQGPSQAPSQGATQGASRAELIRGESRRGSRDANGSKTRKPSEASK